MYLCNLKNLNFYLYIYNQINQKYVQINNH